MPRQISTICTLVACALGLAWPVAQAAEVNPAAHAANLTSQSVQVVYHVVDGNEQAMRALVNIRNHLNAEPSTKIVLVALGAGVDFLLEGAREPNGQSFAVRIGALASQGVQIRVCKTTLTSRNIDPAKLLPEARLVSSGVAEIARLQVREGFAYIRP